jgi:glutamate N-acetyltransferase/amino-acid N-acetyltransferase
VAVNLPAGFLCAGTSSGIKSGDSSDLGVIVSDSPVVWAGTFTRNAAAAAPVLWCKNALGRQVRAVLVNSGNANACTGAAGSEAVEREAAALAGAIGCASQDVLISSTGPIGLPLPVNKIERAVPDLIRSLTPEVGDFASSILTTDTRIKISERRAGAASIVGVGKGAAMLAPNMATMLAFVATDAEVDADALGPMVFSAVDRSFNRLCIDACESTNDSVIALASGAAGSVDADEFGRALTEVCVDLAEQMVVDAEGGSKVVRIRVLGASDDGAALALAKAVASSTLWRAATYGADPNWGRVLAALGSVDRSLRLDAVELSIGPETMFASGTPTGSLEAAAKVMAAESFEVNCVVGDGPATVEVLTSDLSPAYVELNAYGTT